MTGSWIILLLLSGFVWLGFVLNTSGGEGLVLGKYSTNYFAGLLGITLIWLLLLFLSWRNRNRLHCILRVYAANILVTAVLLVLVLPGIYIYLHHQSLQKYILKPIGDKAHAFFQIDMSPSLPKNTNRSSEIRVLAIGGSTTYGTELEREQSYPAVLGELLNNRYTDKNFVVFNAGVPWHTTMHSLLRYVGLYSDWNPHVVLVMHAFNDIFQTSEGHLTSGKFRHDYGHYFGALGNRINIRDHFADTTIRIITQNWLARVWYSDLLPRTSRPKKADVDLVRALPSFERNLREMHRRVQHDNAELVLLTQPYLYHDGMSEEEMNSLFYEYYYRDYAVVPTVIKQRLAIDAFNDCVRELAAALGSGFIDLEVQLDKSLDMMFDDVHYTPRGARRVAEVLLDKIDWGSILKRISAQEDATNLSANYASAQ